MSVLLTTIEELKEYVAVDFIDEFDVIEFAINEREAELKREYLGTATFETLATKVSEATIEGVWADLLKICHRLLANLAFLDYIPEGQLEISASGIRIVTGEDRKTAFDWQIKKLEAKYLKSGNKAIEDLLFFLNENADDFTDWTASKAYTKNKKYLINSVEAFEEYVIIDSSRKIFLQLLPAIKRIEEFHIQEAIGEEFYQVLRELVLDLDDDQATWLTVFRLLRGSIAHLTAADQAALLNVDKENHDKYGNSYLQKLKAHLNEKASAELYPEYYNSDKYTAPENYSQDFIDNSKFDGKTYVT